MKWMRRKMVSEMPKKSGINPRMRRARKTAMCPSKIRPPHAIREAGGLADHELK
jgi:hypothetical protein